MVRWRAQLQEGVAAEQSTSAQQLEPAGPVGRGGLAAGLGGLFSVSQGVPGGVVDVVHCFKG